MSGMVYYLVYHCPDNDKIYLGVSHRVRTNRLDCQLDADWTKAFIRISGAVGALEVGYHLRSTPWQWSRTFLDSGEITEVREEELLSLGMTDDDGMNRLIVWRR